MDNKAYREKIDLPNNKYKFWLYVTTVKAKSLTQKDTKNKTSDPYCFLKVNSQEFRGKVVFQSTQPAYNQVFRFGIIDFEETLRVEIFHLETFLNDPSLGYIEIPLKSLKTLKRQQKFHLLKNGEKGQIELKLEIVSAPPQTFSPKREKYISKKSECTIPAYPFGGYVSPKTNTQRNNFSTQQQQQQQQILQKKQQQQQQQPKPIYKPTPKNQTNLTNTQNTKTTFKSPQQLQTNETKTSTNFGMKQNVQQQNKLQPNFKSTQQSKLLEKDNSPKSQTKIDLELEYVYGYRGWEGRNNIHFTKSGEVAYFAAKIGIVLNLEKNTQKFFFGHDNEITCIMIHPSGNIVATGQNGDNSKICIWDTDNCSLITTFNVQHKGGVVYLAFSNDGKKLISIGSDDDHTINLYDLESNRLLDSKKGHGNKLLSVDFDPNNPDRFVICGIRIILFGTCTDGKLNWKEGDFGNKQKIMLLSIVFNYNGEVLTGTSQGDIAIWDYSEMKIKKTIRTHVGPCVTIHNTKEGVFASGGKDGKVKLFKSEDYSLIVTITKIIAGPIRSVDYKDGLLIVGTNKNQIWKANVRTNEVELAVYCHGEEIHGLACDIERKRFVTGSDDRTIIAWDALGKKNMRKKPVNGQPRAVVFSNNGAFLGIGLKDGEFIILRAADFAQIVNKKEITTGIVKMSFSSDSHYLAILDYGGKIHIYDAFLGFKRSIIINNVGTKIFGIDWSSDSAYLRVCNYGVVNIYDCSTGKLVRNLQQELQWDTKNAIYSQKQTNISTINIHKNGNFLVGNSKGEIKLFSNQNSIPKILTGHSSIIAGVEFLQYSHILSIGGEDKCIFQWRLKY
ncbi:echinoderm microtubule-associated protein-like elp-1 [Anaeramoeba flamelloides]|uniref:Echinoderm microtubule-associated protein-like elp-1 n=1 Tax=Anaeramoeba flamelloides TaxID=1746091 RepID=A0ABQ8XAC6_9EUKA|nr:echinoderm microtubule-associated protein-like elp-1 [Anaeramoeba flamelloides]